MYQRILVPLDKSETSRRSLPYAALLGRALGLKLDLIYVVPWSRITGVRSALSAEPWTEIEQAATRAGKQYLESVADSLRSGGLEVTTAVLAGDPADEIKSEAGAVPDTLVVMTTQSESSLGQWAIGSVTGKVVHSGVCPTLVVRAATQTPESPNVSTIILPVDGSLEAEAAAPHAAALAKALGAEVLALRAVGPSAYGYDDFSDIAPDTYARLEQAIQQQADAYLEALEARLRREGAGTVRRSTPVDGPASAIVAAAGDGTNAIVVMTSYIRRVPDGVTFGSVTDRVVRHSPAPVLVVPPPRGE